MAVDVNNEDEGDTPFRGRSPREGVERTYWPNGNLRSAQGRLADGSEIWTFWYPDGRVQQELVPGEFEGTSEVRRYRPDGSLSSSISYRDGRKHGTWREYAPDGRLVRERRYNDGRPEVV